VRATFKILPTLNRSPVRFFTIQGDHGDIFFGGDIANVELAFNFIKRVHPFDICSWFQVCLSEQAWLFTRATSKALWPEIVGAF
jgi:hypothetical protein